MLFPSNGIWKCRARILFSAMQLWENPSKSRYLVEDLKQIGVGVENVLVKDVTIKKETGFLTNFQKEVIKSSSASKIWN